MSATAQPSQSVQACAIMGDFCAKDIDDRIAFLRSHRKNELAQVEGPPSQDAIAKDAFLAGLIVGYERSKRIVERNSAAEWEGDSWREDSSTA